MVTGFIKLNGMTVGAAANCTTVYDEEGKESEKFDNVLSAKGCEGSRVRIFLRRIRDSGTDSDKCQGLQGMQVL